ARAAGGGEVPRPRRRPRALPAPVVRGGGQGLPHARGGLYRRPAPLDRDRRGARRHRASRGLPHRGPPPRPRAMTAPQPHETPEAGTVTDGPDRHYRSQLTCIGGGTGLAAALAAARLIDPEPTALVSVVDDGGSSGRLVAERGGLPPGDLRKCLAALAPVDSPWRRLLDHRFVGGGSLGGHALGNLILAALEDQEGDLASA